MLSFFSRSLPEQGLRMNGCYVPRISAFRKKMEVRIREKYPVKIERRRLAISPAMRDHFASYVLHSLIVLSLALTLHLTSNILRKDFQDVFVKYTIARTSVYSIAYLLMSFLDFKGAYKLIKINKRLSNAILLVYSIGNFYKFKTL